MFGTKNETTILQTSWQSWTPSTRTAQSTFSTMSGSTRPSKRNGNRSVLPRGACTFANLRKSPLSGWQLNRLFHLPNRGEMQQNRTEKARKAENLLNFHSQCKMWSHLPRGDPARQRRAVHRRLGEVRPDLGHDLRAVPALHLRPAEETAEQECVQHWQGADAEVNQIMSTPQGVNDLMSLGSDHNSVNYHRFYLVEKIKDCSRIGVLVGTLGVSRYRDIIDRVIASIQGSHPIDFLHPKEAQHPKIQGQVGMSDVPLPSPSFLR